MFIVKDKQTGLYYKRGDRWSKIDANLVEINKATIYRSKAAIKNSLGKWTDSGKTEGFMKITVGKMILDDHWIIEEINISIKD